MAFTDNERVQEIFLVIGDRFAVVNKKWWYFLAVTLIAAIPGYYVLKFTFAQSLIGGYTGPRMIYTSVAKEPLVVTEKKIFELPNQTYGGYVKIRNVELEWGVESVNFIAEFKTFGGSAVNTVNRSTYILPASEKLIVLPRFTSDRKPDELTFTLGEVRFIHKPDISATLEVERTSMVNQGNFIVSSALKNLTPFTIRQVDLPVAIYNNRNEIVGVNFTYVNDVRSNETRTFQYSWPSELSGAVRAEINPEVNIFDRNIFSTEDGSPPSTSSERPQ